MGGAPAWTLPPLSPEEADGDVSAALDDCQACILMESVFDDEERPTKWSGISIFGMWIGMACDLLWLLSSIESSWVVRSMRVWHIGEKVEAISTSTLALSLASTISGHR